MLGQPKFKLISSYPKSSPASAASAKSFGEDPPGLALGSEFDLMKNFMWANDYPHHEGTWPHSAAAIERTMGDLSDEDRASVLGGNAARFLNIEN